MASARGGNGDGDNGEDVYSNSSSDTAIPAVSGFLAALAAHLRHLVPDPTDLFPLPTIDPSRSPSPAALPQMADGAMSFCADDTVGMVGEKHIVGVVDRSFGDIDTHEPRPQRDYDVEIQRHPEVPHRKFQDFLHSGIPPRGTVLVSWQHVQKTELVPEARLELLDRQMYVGDVVRKSAKDHMSGSVIGTKLSCTLFPLRMFNTGIITEQETEALFLRDIPASEFFSLHDFAEGALVVYKDWVGRVTEAHDKVAVRLGNNTVVVVENAAELECDQAPSERVCVGDTVTTKKGNLRRGVWKYGAFDPSVPPKGVVVETRTVRVVVNWLASRLDSPLRDEPPAVLEQAELESEHFRRYDVTGSLEETLPLSADGDRIYHISDAVVGDRVRFKDLPAAEAKYNGSQGSKGKLIRVPRTATLGYDINIFLVLQTHTRVVVRWQDLSESEHLSTELLPDTNIHDEDEVWPGELVGTKEESKSKPADMNWATQPAKVGIVQSVQSRDRIATVRWFEEPEVRLFEDDLIPPVSTGQLGDASEDVSLYSIHTLRGLTRRRGDFVVIHPEPGVSRTEQNTKPGDVDWFGEVVDLGLDGKITVRLGVARPVRDVRVAPERVTVVYTPEVAQGALEDALYDDEYSDEDYEDEDEEEVIDMWAEYEGIGRQPMDNQDEDDWSTEDEDGDKGSDTSMPDLESLPDTGDRRAEADQPAVGNQANAMDVDPHKDNSLEPSTQLTGDATMEGTPTTTPAQKLNVEGGPLTPFLVLETPPPASHHYINFPSSAQAPGFTKRMVKEHKILRTSLPPGIFVRTWESRLDLIRVLMIGPSDTPYEYAPFIIDFQMDSRYPQEPPKAFFHSWTNGGGPVNPNLYEDGKICLSLLGTWHSDERNEAWSPAKSTLLQVLISIHSLVLVKEPYYNEAGFDIHRTAPETKPASALYTERSYFKARGFIVHALTHLEVAAPFEEELKYLYLSSKEGAPMLLYEAIIAAKKVLLRSENDDDGERDGLTRISRGAVMMLKQQVEKLEELSKRTEDRRPDRDGV